MSGSKRLDQHLVDMGAYPSRARAQAAIGAGKVRVNGAPATKPAQKISDADRVETDGDVHPYVSRGGVKLAAALKAMAIDVKGAVCLDLGASTGGFTDVLLREGAAKIYAADVGRGQLHDRIKADPRVVNLEKTHADDLSPSLIPEPIAVIVCDVSFISLKRALPPALMLAAPGARLVALIKPQFEVGRGSIGKGGLVRPTDAARAAADIEAWIAALPDWRVLSVMDSPIAGGDGNHEYLIGAEKADVRGQCFVRFASGA